MKCINEKCNLPIKKYTYWIGDDYEKGKDGPYCKSCAQFIGHIRGEKITSRLSGCEKTAPLS